MNPVLNGGYCTLRNRDSIIALVKKRSATYLKRIHKFGIECPKTVEDALELYKCKQMP